MTSDIVLHAYADASGKEETVTDKILAVNGCIATPTQWDAFDIEWQAYLKAEGFRPHEVTEQYVFHTTEFLTRNCDLMPKNLSKRDMDRIYDHLIDLICAHTLYRFGAGVSLVDFRQFEADYPYGREELFKHPGTYISHECFHLNSRWATDKGFAKPVDYMFDQGDQFWGPMFDDYRKQRRKIPLEDRTVGNLTDGCSAEHSPLQAADVIAWECRVYCLLFKKGHLTGLISPPKIGSRLGRLISPKESADLRLYSHKDFLSSLREYFEGLLTEDGRARVELYMGHTGEPTNEEIDAFARYYLDFCKHYDIKVKQKLLDDWRARKHKNEQQS